MTVRLGTDLGNVIIRLPSNRTADGGGFEGFLNAPPVKGAFEAVSTIAWRLGADKTFAICKCKDEQEILEWLFRRNFFAETGFRRSNLFFCREVWQKARIAESLGLTHYVDDTPAVFTEHMRRVVPSCMLFEAESVPPGLDGVLPVRDWPAVLGQVLQ